MSAVNHAKLLAFLFTEDTGDTIEATCNTRDACLWLSSHDSSMVGVFTAAACRDLAAWLVQAADRIEGVA